MLFSFPPFFSLSSFLKIVFISYFNFSTPVVADNTPLVDSPSQQQTHQEFIWMSDLSSQQQHQQQQQNNLSEMQLQYQAQMQYYLHQMYMWQQSISANQWPFPTMYEF